MDRPRWLMHAPPLRCAAHAKSLLDQLHAWLSEVLDTLPRKFDTSRAIPYALAR
jgi:hypothetical protein